MAIEFFTVTNPAATTTTGGAGSRVFSLSLTSGRGLLLFPFAANPAQTIDFTSITLSVGGSPSAGPATYNPGDNGGRWFYLDNLSAGGSIDVTVNFTGATNGAQFTLFALQVTGHDLSAGFDGSGTGSANPVTVLITPGTANDAIVAYIAGGATHPVSIATYTEITGPTGNYDSTVLYNVDVGAATQKTLSPDAGYYGYAVAIKAGGGGGGQPFRHAFAAQSFNTIL